MSKSFLDDLGVAFQTDKCSIYHNYLVEYEKLFPEREQVKWVMEIGVQRGAKKWRTRHPVPSLKMWKEFLPNAEIIGVDIKDIDYAEDRLYLMQVDQSNEKDLSDLAKGFSDFDLILDDGSHKPDDQMLTFNIMKESVKTGGIYIIEDCNAVAQNEYPNDERIHAVLARTDLSGWETSWIESKDSGPKSAFVMRKL